MEELLEEEEKDELFEQADDEEARSVQEVEHAEEAEDESAILTPAPRSQQPLLTQGKFHLMPRRAVAWSSCSAASSTHRNSSALTPSLACWETGRHRAL